MGKMKTIPLTRGKVALVDDEDYEHLVGFNWYAYNNKDRWYAARRSGNTIVLMHREILGTPKEMLTDHADHNGLNNQRSNIRVATSSQNSANSRKRKGTITKYKGVYLATRRNGFVVFASTGAGESVYLGMFPLDEQGQIDGARAYDKFTIEHFGEFACTNFPKEDYL